MAICVCGECGLEVKPGKRYVRGHNKPAKGIKKSEAHKRFIGDANRGRKRSDLVERNKLGKGKKRPEFSLKYRGENHFNFGRKASEDTCIKISTGLKRTFARRKRIRNGERSIKGYWKGLYFGSTCELLQMMNHPNFPYLKRGPTIPYKMYGSRRYYFSDLFDSSTKTVEEIKCVGKKLSKEEELKIEAGKNYCKKNGLTYKLIYVESIPKKDIFILRKHFVISLDKKYEKEFQDWMVKNDSFV